MPGLEKRFAAAQAEAKRLPSRPDDDSLLELYSYFKQATEGDVKGDKPGFTDFVNRAKYEAWAKLKGMPADEAMKAYVKLVERVTRE